MAKKFYTKFTQKLGEGRGGRAKKCSVSKGFRVFEGEKSSSLRTKRSEVSMVASAGINRK